MEKLIGLTPKKIVCSDDVLTIWFTDGSKAEWYHDQDCCEHVYIESEVGDWNDLIGHPLLVAEERDFEDTAETKAIEDEADESCTWTFYTFRNVGGSVDIRWFGSSNGYYSERVDFKFTHGVA